MSEKHAKEKLIETIERLESNPSDRVELLASIGVTAIGAAGAGAVAAVVGATTVSIPIVTAVTGITLGVAAAPAALVAGAALAGGAAVYSVTRFIKDGGFQEGKRQQLFNEQQDKLREIEAEERRSNVDDLDKARFYSRLKEPLKHDLITPDDAHELMQAVEQGHISLSEACYLVEQVLADSQVTQPKTSEKVVTKVVTACPNCYQKLRAPSNLGRLNLTCPRCRYGWLWLPN